ncbi:MULTISPECIES: recombinase family protein [Pseudomonas]|uniref:recombinase family protein n=1 Tax=Pseudomonas TaxID=286 RepID=UPI000696A3F5|nr:MULTISPECIES: recombinase family protein [Pseudomonas]
MPLAISYVRFSSKAQEEGDSLRRQRQMAADWISRNPDYTLSDVRYEDLGLSASKGHHLGGNLGKILEAVESGAIPSGSVILVETLDRFSRLPAIQTLTMLQSVVERGVDLITLNDGVRYNQGSVNSSQLFMLAGAALGAYEYSRQLARRVKESFAGRSLKAKAGQRINRRNGFWLNSDGTLKGPDETAIVNDVFDAFVRGTSIHELARKHSKHFANPSSVRKLLTNVAVIGHWQQYSAGVDKVSGKTIRAPADLIKNVFDPAIDEVLFHQAQQLMRKQETVTHARANPLAGIVVCATCGGNFAKRNANGKNATATMSCYTRGLNKANCTNSKNYPMPVLGAVFFETMRGHVFTSLQKTKLGTIEKERVLLEALIDENETKRRRLMPLIADGDDPLALDTYQALKAEHADITRQLAALPKVGNSGTVLISDVYKTINGDPFALAKTLQLGGYRIVCDEHGVMRVGDEVYEYAGYVRKGRTHWIKLPNGEVESVDALLRAGGSEPQDGELPPDDHPEDHDLEIIDNPPYIEWKRQRPE